MPCRYSMIVWAMVATVLAGPAAYSEDLIPAAPAPAAEFSLLDPPPAAAGTVLSPGLRLNSAPQDMGYLADAPAWRPDTLGYQFENRPPAPNRLNLTPVIEPIKPGWHFSGRLGPLRWLSSLEGEGGTAMRFGGRVSGQPRIEKGGNFNIGLHYNFE